MTRRRARAASNPKVSPRKDVANAWGKQELFPVQKKLLQEAAYDATGLISESVADNTVKAYTSDFDYWRAWAMHALAFEIVYGESVPIPLVVKFITDHRKGLSKRVDKALLECGAKSKPGRHAMSTVERRIASLSKYHTQNGLENPCKSREVKETLKAAKKVSVKSGDRPNRKHALVLEPLEQLLSTCDGSLLGKRDAALLLFAFSSGGRRRSEVARADMADLREVGEDFTYTLPYSKTDQAGENTLTVPIAGRAAHALKSWLAASSVSSGRIFRRVRKGGKSVSDSGISDKTVANIVKRRAIEAGLDPRVFSGHSLRSGFVTESGRQRVPLPDSMAMSGHKTVRVAVGYYQPGNSLRGPGAKLAG